MKELAAKAKASLLVGGWFIFSQLVPFAIQQVFQPFAVEHARTSSPLPRSAAVTARIPTAAAAARSTTEELAERRQTQIQATARQKQNDLAWAAFYAAPAACEHPLDWNAQVECGNQSLLLVTVITPVRRFASRDMLNEVIKVTYLLVSLFFCAYPRDD